MHIFEQKEAVHQTLGNMAPVALLPYSYKGERGEGFTVELEGGLPFRRCPRCRRYIHPGLDSWPLVTMPVDGRGGVRMGTSPKFVGVFSIVRGLFLVRLVGGGRGGV